MNSAEWVTQFSLTENGKPKPVRELLDVLNAHLKTAKLEAEEYHFCLSPSLNDAQLLPKQYRWLVAFAVEGYYVHVGAMMQQPHDQFRQYMDFGFAKTYSAESAYAIAKEAQRFLSAAVWN